MVLNKNASVDKYIPLTIQKVNDEFISLLGRDILVRGRIISVRRMKKSVFADIFWKTFKIQCRFYPDLDYCPGSGDLVEVMGKCFYTNTKEPTIDVSKVSLISKWKAEIEYKNLLKSRIDLFHAFVPETYKRVHFSQVTRNFIRQFLCSRNYFEVQTPILGKNYNGGKSFPVISSYIGKSIGFNRTTMEDRMQALIALGYERIFQMGSIFRSEKENTFLEGYEVFLKMEDGKDLIKDMLSYVVGKLIGEGIGKVDPSVMNILNKKWLEIDFFDGSSVEFGMNRNLISSASGEMIKILTKKGVIKKEETSLESIADEIANTIASRTGVPTIVNGFPIWSSPLYKPYGGEEASIKIERSRMYFPCQKGGFEIGIQENNYDRFIRRLKNQRESWGIGTKNEYAIESDLAKVISGGLPPMFGFGLNPDRIVKIWQQNCTIDPYQE